ncbi:unnamed protein product [Haemonchus placei]|uniref:Uncharacterized protein n=1 Tax=Haemonchus placei TaxID=6290 RepID=A0A0N4W5Q1_HAEPC|nr:unnamed protein product [Haemonchus placei]
MGVTRCVTLEKAKLLPGRELNPGLACDRRGYSPLYYRGHKTGATEATSIFNDSISLALPYFMVLLTCYIVKKQKLLPGRELNPGLACDRRGYSPLYYRGSVH